MFVNVVVLVFSTRNLSNITGNPKLKASLQTPCHINSVSSTTADNACTPIHLTLLPLLLHNHTMAVPKSTASSHYHLSV